MTVSGPTSPVGLHRVLAPAGALPQAADRLDDDPQIAEDEVRLRVERLNLDAASFRQLTTANRGDGAAVRRQVLDTIAARGKMQNPVTGSGGMLIGVVDEVGPRSPLGLRMGQRVATLVSLSLTPLRITDGLTGWDGRSEQVPAEGHAILFGRSIAAVLPDDLPADLAMAVLDVCGAPALTSRVVASYLAGPQAHDHREGERAEPLAHDHRGGGRARAGVPVRLGGPMVAVIGGAGKSGSLSLVAAREAGAARTVGVVPTEGEADLLREAALADVVAVADARDPVALAAAIEGALGGRADVTVVCVDVPGCEHGAVLSTGDGGTVVFFSMATSFSAAALGAEGLAADVTMLIGNGYVPGHAELALDLVRRTPTARALFEHRLRH